MLPSTRRLPVPLLRRLAAPARPASTSTRHSDKVPTNDPQPPKDPPNVSESNALPVSAQGIRDGTMQESPEDGERRRAMQAPNRAGVWSRSQQPRERAMAGPRFEQTMMEYQVSFPSPFGQCSPWRNVCRLRYECGLYLAKRTANGWW